MDKGVVISIRPKHCQDILALDKTLEIRKNKPNLPTPFKCYIYETRQKMWRIINGKRVSFDVGGKVIAEFICDEIIPIRVFENGSIQDWNHHELSRACITYKQMADYIGCDKIGYAWHISNLKVYDRPKHLDTFAVDSANNKYMTRAPQSWGYVEVI